MNDQFEGTRSGQRAKRRKTNIILNSLIAIILLLIIIVAANIFLSDDETATEQTKVETKEKSKPDNQDEEAAAEEDSQATETTEDTTTTEDTEDTDDTVTEDTEQEEENGEVIETAGGSDADVKKTLVNPAWQPIGTSQTGEHTAVYDQNAVDWKEMLQAISLATGIDGGNMTVWRLGNNGPNKSVGTVSAKDNSQKYRVFIEWVDGEGWKPTKVEELK